MASKYKAMIFDMDGTLLDSMWYWRTIWREYIELRGLPMPEELKDKVMFFSSVCAEMLANETGHPERRKEIYRDMLDSCLGPHYMNDAWPKPFAKDLLKMLRDKGYRVAVATATPRHLAEPALARHGMLELLDFVTDTIEMGCGKSEPDFFRKVAEKLGAAPEECVMFEDAVYAMRGAKAAGMGVVAIDEPVSWQSRDEIRALADRYIMHWGELTGTGTPPKYRNIVLDFGGVIGRFDQDMLASFYCDNLDDRALLKAAVSDGWIGLDAGTTDYDAFHQTVLGRLPARLHGAADRFFESWMVSLPYMRGMPELIHSLRERHYHLFLLSNAPVVFAERIGHYKAVEGFDRLLVSGPLKMLKPDRAIYEYLLRECALDPARTLFVDDSLRNVEGARACGIDAFHYTDNIEELTAFIEKSEQESES